MSYIEGSLVTKTNFSANGQQLAADVSGYNTARFEFSGTYSFTAVFEASADSTNGTDGTWFPFDVAAVNAPTVLTSHVGVNAVQAYEASVHSVKMVRVRLTAFTSAGTHRVAISGNNAAIEPSPRVQLVNSPIVSTPAGTAYSLVTAASTNAAVIKSTAGNLFEIEYSNPTATAISVKLYNKATAPTVGTDVPIVTETIAAGATVQRVYGNIGKRFATGLGIAATALPAATDTGVAVAGVQVHGSYI